MPPITGGWSAAAAGDRDLGPTSAFMRVDFPTFGRPVKHAKPERKPRALPRRGSCDDITPDSRASGERLAGQAG